MAVPEKKGFFDKPGNVQRFLIAFFISLAALLVVDFFIAKHGHWPFENVPNFFAAYGFVSCVVLVLVAKVLRLMIKRPEDYYDR